MQPDIAEKIVNLTLIKQQQLTPNILQIQPNLTYVTVQGSIERWSHKTGGHLIQVK